MLLALPGVSVALLDLQARRALLTSWPARTLVVYLVTLLVGAVMWAGLVAAASARGGWLARALLVAGATMAVGAQVYFFGRYHAFMNPRAVLVGTSMMPSVGQQLWSD